MWIQCARQVPMLVTKATQIYRMLDTRRRQLECQIQATITCKHVLTSFVIENVEFSAIHTIDCTDSCSRSAKVYSEVIGLALCLCVCH